MSASRAIIVIEHGATTSCEKSKRKNKDRWSYRRFYNTWRSMQVSKSDTEETARVVCINHSSSTSELWSSERSVRRDGQGLLSDLKSTVTAAYLRYGGAGAAPLCTPLILRDP